MLYRSRCGRFAQLAQRSADPDLRPIERVRWHLRESLIQKAFHAAVRRAKIAKHATPHTFRNVRSYYYTSWRNGYLKGKSGCLLSPRESWRPDFTASISRETSGNDNDWRSMIHGVVSTTCVAGNVPSLMKRRMTVWLTPSSSAACWTVTHWPSLR